MAELVLTDEFTRALDLLGSGRHLFLTGKAGTGKSTLIRHFLAETDRAVLVAAPTGIAALNVGGYTLHRLFGFTPTTTVEDVRSDRYRPGRFTKTLATLETLIIDEASMVRADLFDMIAAALEKFGPKRGMPFGGVQVVLVGDLFQLPPVVHGAESAHFTDRYATPYFFSADRFTRDDFPTVALTTVFRQAGDPQMTLILNAIREGTLVEHARETLNARVDPEFEPPTDEFWLTLAPTNRIVTARNRQRLESLPGEEFVSRAAESGDLSLFDPAVERDLRFKVGAQIMLLTNDPAERWANGTLARVVDVRRAEQNLAVSVELPDGDVCEVWPFTWEVTRPSVVGGTLQHEVVGTYTQLPFKLAWAITIHKSQGQTLDRLVVDLSGGAFDFGQVYVALSRCTSMAGLVLKRPVLPKDLKTDRRIVRFLKSADPQRETTRFCAVSMLTVGDPGRMSQPRPVEIAVAFDDGTAISTLVNPQRDLADARVAFGLSVTDVLLAPTLAEAWPVLSALLDGWTPVGVDTDRELGLVDFELKRLGTVASLPLGVDIPVRDLLAEERAGLGGGRALDRALATLQANARLRPSAAGSTAFEADDDIGVAGYLLTRDPDAPAPELRGSPTLADLLTVSRALSAVLVDGDSAATTSARHGLSPASESSVALHRVVVDRLAAAADRTTGLPPELLRRVGELEGVLGAGLVAAVTSSDAGEPTNLDDVLVEGARICFTGTARSLTGAILGREEMNALAGEWGLVPVNSVTKTKCEVLVVAEIGTQSGKARKAKELGKPVLSAEEFLRWVDARERDSPSPHRA